MLKEKLDTLPNTPGIYKFLDEKGDILYIGKATNLRSRVKSYFQTDLSDRPRVKQMIPYISDVETVETDNDVEALVLESILVKEYQPLYNSDLKDDKSYAWIYVSTKEDFPKIKVVRKISEDELKKGRLFGPYPNSSSTRRIFTYLRKIYPFCTCTKKQAEQGDCLYVHLGLCPGPHQGYISKADYRENIHEIVKFLDGRSMGKIKEMEKEMKRYSSIKEYEKAAELRDRINDLKYLGQDINLGYTDTEKSYVRKRERALKNSFEELRLELGLKRLHRIECYDVSNIQGKEAYTSMVVAEDGKVMRNQYRIFKIRGENEPDDPRMLKEALVRRFDTTKQYKYSSSPDIVLIDGGKSQLSVVKEAIPEKVLLLGISKGKRMKRKGSKQNDEFWAVLGDSVDRVEIENRSILVELRDEAHRFAILHHRKARRKGSVRSKLEGIPGVGKRRSKILLQHFKSIEELKNAKTEEIDEIIKNRKVSENIKKYLNR